MKIERDLYVEDIDSAVISINSFMNPSHFENERLIVMNWRAISINLSLSYDIEVIIADITDVYPFFKYNASKIYALALLIHLHYYLKQRDKISELLVQVKILRENLENDISISGDIAILCSLMEVYDLYSKNMYTDAISILKQIKKNKNEVLSLIINEWIGKCHFYLGNYDESNWNLLPILDFLQTQKTSDRKKSDTITYIFRNAIMLNDFDEAERWFKVITALESRLNRNIKLARIYNDMADMYIEQDNYRSIVYYNRAMELYTEINEMNSVSKIMNQLTHVYNDRLEFDMVEKYHRKIIDIGPLYSGLENNLRYIAEAHYFFGEYNTAINYYLESLELTSDEINRNRFDILQHISSAYSRLGFNNLAMKYTVKSMHVAEYLRDTSLIKSAKFQQNLHLINIGKLEQARTNFEQMYIELMSMSVLPNELIRYIKHLFDLAYRINNKELLDKYFKYAEKAKNMFPDNRNINNSYNLMKAKILLTDKTVERLVESRKILKDLLSDASPFFALDVRLLLVDILANELQIAPNLRKLRDISDELNEIELICKTIHQYDKLIKINILRSRILFQKNEFKQAIKLLENSVELATTKNLKNLIPEIKNEQKILADKLDSWRKLIEGRTDTGDISYNAIVEYIKSFNERKQQIKE